jgi:hypothetical protein
MFSLRQQRLMWVLWPAFLAAGVTEVLVFALVDPQEIHWAGQPLLWSREAVYTVAFFLFWAIAIASNGLTALLSMTPEEVNH